MKKTIAVGMMIAFTFIFAPKTQAAFNWADYFSKEEATSIKKMVDKYIRGQIEDDAKNWKGVIGKKQVDDSITKRKVYTGIIPCTIQTANAHDCDAWTDNGEEDDTCTENSYYKKISVPELKLSETPSVITYRKLSSDYNFLGSNVWGIGTPNVEDEYVWIKYGETPEDGNIDTDIVCDSDYGTDYKIVINY